MAKILHSTTEVSLKPAPINPDWILDGTPTARNAVLSRSLDGTTTTMVWECSEGAFEWIYDFDEVIHFLEGAVVIEGEGMPPTRFGPGDVLLFRKGARARWRVEGRIRKLAVCRRVQPRIIGLAIAAVSRVKRLLSSAPVTPSLADLGREGAR